MNTLLFLIIFLAMIAVGIPIFYSMGLLAMIGLAACGMPNFIVVTQRMFAGIDNFTFLCIPLFILAGEIMATCGMLKNLVRFCEAFVGHIRGGLALVNVLASMLFAGISGSATADATGLGRIEMEMMSEAGYDKPYSAAVTAASAIIGPIIPPSNIMIIYAVCAANVSVADMFLAGIIPGILLGLVEMILCYFFAIRYNHPRAEKKSWKERAKVTWETLPALGMPAIILIGIVTGIFTATEASAVAVIYALLVAIVRRSINLRLFIKCCVSSAKTAANVLPIIGIASAMSYAITVMRIPQNIVASCGIFLTNKIIFLVFCNVLLLILGFFLDQAPALLLITPILLPLAMPLGIHPLHFGILVCFNLTIGLITPPVGMTLFVTANVAGIKLSQLFKSIMPFALMGLIALALITIFPQFTTFLPSLMH
ncbi:MAG: TRAP transporter large permease [Spirochaetales bacterium]|nr:TRAP transporter large permease [Spirochaetales bacterium]